MPFNISVWAIFKYNNVIKIQLYDHLFRLHHIIAQWAVIEPTLAMECRQSCMNAMQLLLPVTNVISIPSG